MGNKYGPIVLPIELSTTDFVNIKNIATDLNKGKTSDDDLSIDEFSLN